MSVCFNTKDSVMESNYDDLYRIIIDKKKIFTSKFPYLLCILHVRGKITVFAEKYGFLFRRHRNELINLKKSIILI